MNLNRVHVLQKGKNKSGPVVYWMQRDQRVHDNWALIYAQQKALEKNGSLIVLFNLVTEFLDATIRQYGFMLKGLEHVEMELNEYNIQFYLTCGDTAIEIPKFLERNNASILITDFNPLKTVRRWKKLVADKIDIPFHEVDAHNIVPCLIASNKLEYGAYTIRPKIHKLLPEYLDPFPDLKRMNSENYDKSQINWNTIQKNLKIDFNVPEVDWIIPGEKAALKSLEHFINHKFFYYSKQRNDPTQDSQSNLSPYFHFGQIAPQRVALAIQPFTENSESQSTFLEEMVVRRELSDNFCYYNKDYDSLKGFHTWAKESLNLHRKDKREFIYSLEQFESSSIHDSLWNAAQFEMINTGKMHGYMRMYWAKKILEWSESPEDAMRIVIYLNDKYELDGRDPNGYTGIAWSIGGVHDRAWFERPVYGKIRYMNANGCAKKFDVKKYISQNSVYSRNN
jgi:deoxyribodipyrimidine photo-lyase